MISGFLAIYEHACHVKIIRVHCAEQRVNVLLFDCEVSVAFLFVSLCNDCFNFSLQRLVVQNADNWRLWSGKIMFTSQILGKLVHLCFFFS